MNLLKKWSICIIMLLIVLSCCIMLPIIAQADTSECYTITYHLDGGTNALKNPDVYTSEDTIVLTDATKEGYNFEGWYSDADKTQRITEISNCSGNINLYARFIPKSYTAFFDSNGADISSDLKITLLNQKTNESKVVTLNNGDSFSPYDFWMPTADGCVFGGWLYESELVRNDFLINKDITLVAQWFDNPNNYPVLGDELTEITLGVLDDELYYYDPYQVAFSKYQHFFVASNYYTVSYSGQISVYRINGIYDLTGSSYARIQNIKYEKDKPAYYTVDFIPFSDTMPVTAGTNYEMVISGQGHTSGEYALENTFIKVVVGKKISPKIQASVNRELSQEYDAALNAPNIEKQGYVLAGWYDENGAKATDTWTYTEDKTFTAKWEPVKYSITYELNGGINHASNPATCTIEDSITLKDPTKIGYTFCGWYSDPDFTTPITEISNKSENTTLYAKWEVNRYDLTLDANEGAFAPKVTFISDGVEIKSCYFYGQDTLTAYRPAEKAYSIFAGWYTDDTFTSLYRFNGKIADDLTLYAKWIPCYNDIVNIESVGSLSATIQGKTEILYAFVPLADGKIAITSESNNLDLYGILYDASKNILISADDISSADLDFSYAYNVTAGQLYYIAVKGNTASTAGQAAINVAWTGDCKITGTTYPSRKITVVYDTNYKLPQKLIREGYVFLGWFDENDTQITDGTWDFATNKTLTAKWEEATYHTVVFKDLAGNIISSETYYLSEDIVAPELPAKEPDETYIYHAKWNNDYTGVCTGDAVYSPTYDAEYIEYTVIFADEDGTELSKATYHWGDVVASPAAPTKAADNTYTYTFAGWDKTVANCAGNTTYIATYTPAYIDYTVVFKNWNGTVLSTKTYHYGDKVTAPANPTKAADTTYTYSFAGWDKTVVNCAGNATYTATYNSNYIDYTVVFKDWDGAVLSSTTYHWGDAVTVPTNLTKAADNTYTYTFKGWDKTVVNCVGNATYTATYTPAYIDYTVIFKNWEGTVLSSDTYHYGDAVVVPANPTRAVDNTYIYTFAGWDKTVANCAGNTTYTATYTSAPLKQLLLISQPNKVRYRTGEKLDLTGLTLQGVCADDVIISLDNVDAQFVSADLSTPGRKAVTVTIAGKSAEFEIYVHDVEEVVVNVDPSLYPQSSHNYGSNLDETKTFTYPGAQSLVITFNGQTSVENNYDYIYIYDGAGNQIAKYTGTTAANKTLTITGDTFAVRLTSDSSVVKYGYAFSSIQAKMKNADEIIHPPVTDPATVTCTQDGLTEGSHCEICGDILVAQEEIAALGHNYETVFAWSEDHTSCVVTITCSRNCGFSEVIDCTVTHSAPNQAQTVHSAVAEYCGTKFTDVLTCDNFLIVFKDWNDEQISSKYYHTGDAVTIPVDPSRAADNTYTYTFAGWDKTVVNCAGNATYIATYDSSYIDYTVVFKNWDGTVLASDTYHYGDVVVVPVDPVRDADNVYAYTFTGWDKMVVDCAGDAIYTATYTSAYVDYTVVFKDRTGNIISTKTYHWGDKVVEPDVRIETFDDIYAYLFVGWDKPVVNCVGDATYTAVYTPIYIDYTVVFKNWDGTVFFTQTYHWGDVVTAPEDPTKAADDMYIYTFAGWDREIVNCAGNADYTAIFTATHYHTYGSEIVAPTCTERGYTIYTCACGDTYEDDYTESNGHAYTNNADTYCNHCGAYAYPGGNTLVKENGVWYHVVNRQKVSDTTLVYYGGYWFYVKNGQVNYSNTLCKWNSKWYHVKDGKVVFDTTLVNYGGYWFYVKSGVVDFNATTLCYFGSKWYYVKGGQVNYSNTLCSWNGKWYHVKNGTVVFDTTLVNFGGYWFYVKNGVVDYNATTLCYFGSKWYYVKGGQVNYSNTLCSWNGKWYHVKNGTVVYDTTLVYFGSSWYYVKNGVLNYSNTLCNWNGKWWHVKNGTVVKDTTLVYFGSNWYYVRSGVVDFTYSGKVLFSGSYYTVKNGVKV